MAQPFAEPCSRGVIAAEPSPQEIGGEFSASRRRKVLGACVLASSMAFIDGSALTVALPHLRSDLGANFASVQWVLNGYVLALASLTLIGGALADVYGKARMLAIGCLFFGVMSAACALAPSIGLLIAARIAQGAGAAILTPASLALIGATYPRSERNRAIGVWAAASALTTAAGPVIGGWLTEMFDWRLIFWINPPIAFVTIGLLMAFAPPDRFESRQFDIVGAAILATALGALAWALSEIDPGQPTAGNAAESMSAATLAIVAGTGCAGLVLYALWESLSRHPMTPPRLFENRQFFGLNVATVLLYAGLSVMFFILPFELIDRRGLTSTEAGLVFLPFTLGVGLLSQYFGAIADSTGVRIPLVAGSVGASLAYTWMAFGGGASLPLAVIGPVTLLGISFAVLVTPLTASVMSSVKQSDEGLASGINNAASRIAQLAGVALAAGLASFTFGYELGLGAAAVVSMAGAIVVAATVRPVAGKSKPS
ncbi:MAG: MFS transporter [Rhizobiales bacterium]|nr:MFS transporter [Hyphomicrobiales bacterium]